MSLANKYRPKDFSEVIGHEKVVSSLKQVLKDNRARAFLFTGPSGVGKTTLMRIVANHLAQGKLTASNLIEIDAASKSGAEDMRDTVMRSQYMAVGPSPIKAILIDEAHKLSSAAWTVLLKPTEEPPQHVYWMLATTEVGKVPATILTRFVRFDLRPVSEEKLLELLVTVTDAEGISVPDDVIEAVAEGSGGSPRQALTFLESCAFCASAIEARQIMRVAAESTKGVIDLCQFLMRRSGRTWPEAAKLISGLDDVEAESARIQVVNYLSKVALNTKDPKQAYGIMRMIHAFSSSYNSSDKLAPLVLSVGLAIGLKGE